MEGVIIGRDQEKKILSAALNSGEAELIAIYGRRRVGKTYLIRNHFSRHLAFEFVGMHNADLKEQLNNFKTAIESFYKPGYAIATPTSWSGAFQVLSAFLQDRLKKPCVILLDEFPWIHSKRSGFLEAFTYWWNTWASKQPQLKVVICGSAASWMIEKVMNSKGGLHNRVTRVIRLLPFTLKETEAYLLHRNIRLEKYQILILYMAIGGVPHYLKQVNKGESAQQVIDRLFFQPHGFLASEFDILYQSLFNNASNHEQVVSALAKKPQGLTRTQLIAAAKLTTGGTTTAIFEELEQSGFIAQYIPFGKTSKEGIYKLTDEYSLFYLKFVEGARSTGMGTWHKLASSSSFASWSGYAFENICQKHIVPIKEALGIAAVMSDCSPWRYVTKNKNENGAQIDLLIDRQDNCINLCEMKFSISEYVIDKRYASELDHKVNLFREKTRTRKTIFPTIISTFGVKQNEHFTGRIQAEVTMEDLFR